MRIGNYIGQYLNNKRNGVGLLVLFNPDGNCRNTIIEGIFKNNFLQGKGRMIFNDGSYYQGQFKDNLMHG